MSASNRRQQSSIPCVLFEQHYGKLMKCNSFCWCGGGVRSTDGQLQVDFSFNSCLFRAFGRPHHSAFQSRQINVFNPVCDGHTVTECIINTPLMYVFSVQSSSSLTETNTVKMKVR